MVPVGELNCPIFIKSSTEVLVSLSCTWNSILRSFDSPQDFFSINDVAQVKHFNAKLLQLSDWLSFIPLLNTIFTVIFRFKTRVREFSLGVIFTIEGGGFPTESKHKGTNYNSYKQFRRYLLYFSSVNYVPRNHCYIYCRKVQLD